jgi:1-acylglycerone phosphate reductase
MQKKTILITGCSDGGLGSALALAMHKKGWRVIATARNPAKMASMKSAGIEMLSLDVQSQASLSTAATEVGKLTGGSLDALLNNAGGGYSMPIADVALSEAKKVFDLNVWAIITTTQAFLPLLLKSPRGAMIVNHTSSASVFGVPFQGVYNASKAAAAMITENMRLELAPFGIRVFDLKTGQVKSNFFKNVGDLSGLQKLPHDSIYQIARETVEETMTGDKFILEGDDADAWAASVVDDLSKKHPPTHVWRGKNARLLWFSTILPHGTLDSKVKQFTGLDVLERELKKPKA